MIANITYPSGTVNQLTLLNSSDFPNKFNISFTIPALAGTYNITFIANDSSNNINASETTSFTATSSVAPAITPLGCNVSVANLSESVQCNATVIDETGISLVQANVTLPNGTVSVQKVGNTSTNYHFNFTTTVFVGKYNILWWANDTDNNINKSIDSFNVTDSIEPGIILNAPINNSNTSSTTTGFNFTAIDNYYSTLSCSVILDGTLNSTNPSAANNTATIITISGISAGSHYWSVNCSDASNNINSSETRKFTVDLDSPRFISLTTAPTSTDDLDPDTLINITANITDNTTSVQTAIFQYKLSSDSAYTNLTMQYNGSVFNASFNATAAGTYNLRLWANDTVGNHEYSNIVNIDVQQENTWSRLPASFPVVSGEANTNVTLGNITINNTGDSALNFTITSDSALTVFNDTGNASINFTLDSGAVKIVEVNDTAPVSGSKSVTITIDASASGGSPASQITTGTIIVAPGQPILSATFTVPSTDTLEVTQGDTGVTFTVQLENIGTGNATNATSFITVPENWTVTFGSKNHTYEEFNSGDLEENTIVVSIPSSFSTGTYGIIVNATGFNTSGADLAALGIVFGDRINVTVNAPAAELGAPAAPSAAAPSGASTGGGGGGGGGTGGGFSRAPDKEIIETTESFEIVRGEGDSFYITIRNTYDAATMKDIKISLEGYLSQYLGISPLSIKEIKPGESKRFIVTIKSPKYMAEQFYELDFTINAQLEEKTTITAEDGSEVIVTSAKDFIEKRTINLYIHEVSRETAENTLGEAEQALSDMQREGIPSKTIESLIEEARKALEEKDYKRAKELAEKIAEIKETALEANELINKLKQGISDAKERGLDMSEAEHMLALAMAAFEREDFEAALQRAKEANLNYVWLAKGKASLFWILKTFWWAILLASVLLLFTGKEVKKRTALIIIERRIEDLDKEEDTISNLVKEIQQKAFQKNEISVTEYQKQLKGYEDRLTELRLSRARLRTRRSRIIKLAEDIETLKKENNEVIEKIKILQDAYFNKKSVTRRDYERESEELNLRKTEIEGAIVAAETTIIEKETSDALKRKEKRIEDKHERKRKKSMREQFMPNRKKNKILAAVLMWIKQRIKNSKEKLSHMKKQRAIKKQIKEGAAKHKEIFIPDRQLTKEQIDKIEEKVQESAKKSLLSEDILRKISEKAKVIMKSSNQKRFDTEREKNIRLRNLKEQFEYRQTPQSRKKSTIKDDINRLEKHGFKIRKPEQERQKLMSTDPYWIKKQARRDLRILFNGEPDDEPDEPPFEPKIIRSIPRANTFPKENIIKTLKEAYKNDKI